MDAVTQGGARGRLRGFPAGDEKDDAANEGHGFTKKDNADFARAVEALFLIHHLGLEDVTP